MKTAIVIGATGLVGSNLIFELLKDERYSKVKIFGRRTIDFIHPKLEEEIVNFDSISEWKHKITGNDLFSAIGTTIKKAGSKEAQFKIDFTYQYVVAKAAADNGVDKYLLVSSAGANHKSKNFYLKIKGSLEESVFRLPFKHIYIFQPSILAGERIEKRKAEKFFLILAKFLTVIIPFIKKYRPIEAQIVARAMINAANDSANNKIITYTLNQIFDRA